MKKIKIFITVLFTMIYTGAFASYIDHLQTQSAEWTGNPTRTAATDSLDCIYYNPAGTVLMENGLHTSLTMQVIAFPNEVEVTDSNYPGQQKYKSSTPPAYVPSMFINYRHEEWAVFGGFCIIGGGGSLFWPNGLPNINSAVQKIDLTAGWKNSLHYWRSTGEAAMPYAGGNVTVFQESKMPGLILGGAYAVNSRVSVSVGARVVYSDEGMKVKVNQSGQGTTGDYTVWDGKWTGVGYCGIVGVDVKPVENLNLALTFETLTKLEREIDVDTDNSNSSSLSFAFGYADGESFRFDLPAKLSFGAEYTLFHTLKLSFSGIVYFPQWGTYEKPEPGTLKGRESFDLKTPYEIGVGFDWEFMKGVSWTGGVNYSCMNLKDEQMNEGGMIKNDLVDLGIGIKLRTQSGMNLAIGYMRNIYTEKENYSTAGTSSSYKTKFRESASNVAISAEYRFL